MGLPVMELPPMGFPLSPAFGEPARLYAERVEVIQPPGVLAEPTALPPSMYQVADPAGCGRALDPDRFHEPSYRPTLAAAVAHVLALEGPVYEEVLVRRIARAHGFARTGARIAEAVAGVVGPGHARSQEDGRAILWPLGQPPAAVIPFRPSPQGGRHHADIPAAELAGLAGEVMPDASGQDPVRLLAARLGLSRLEATTRLRLEQAIRLARAEAGTVAS